MGYNAHFHAGFTPPPMKRFLALAALPLLAPAAPPADLAIALEFLRDQQSYSWQSINADRGPVRADIETMRGSVVAVQRNNAPNVEGSIDRAGNMLVRREWPDGLELVTLFTADGAMVTRTPEGWMTTREILTAQAEERMRDGGPSPRILWLRRADRPEIARPDKELAQLLTTKAPFEEIEPGAYLVRGRARPEDTLDEDHGYRVAITLRLSGGVIRDYEVEIDGTQAIRRAGVRLPVNEHRIVILSYAPKSTVDAPPEAWEKLEQERRDR